MANGQQQVPTDLERQAKAAADSADLDLKKKQAEFAEWEEGRTQRAGEAAANLQALLLKNEESQRAAVKDMTPDLTGVQLGSLAIPESGTLFEALLGGRALQDAARKVGAAVKSDTGLGNDYKVLVTTDLNLAARDARHLTVVAQLKLLTALIEQWRLTEGGGTDPSLRELALPLVPIATAAAQLLPGMLSLLATKRILSVSSGTVDDNAAMMAVAGDLAGRDPGGVVVVEQARLLAANPVPAWTELQTECVTLAGEINALKAQPDHDEKRVVEGTSLLTTCQAALAAMAVPGEGGAMSALSMAALQEALHGEEFGGVLIIKGGAASATQLVEDRQVRSDQVSIVSTATISYLLVDHRNGSKVIRGGLAHGAAQMHGKIGGALPLPT